MGEVIPFPLVKRAPGDGLQAAMDELDKAMAELRALCAKRDALLGQTETVTLSSQQYRDVFSINDDGA